MSNKAALLLLPNLLGDSRHAEVFLPSSVFKAMQAIDGLIAESDKEGRRYLSRFETKKPAAETPIALFNEHTPDADLDYLLEPIVAGERWGLVSDAGLPCIADPGSKLVRRAHAKRDLCPGICRPFFNSIGLDALRAARTKVFLSGIFGQRSCQT